MAQWEYGCDIDYLTHKAKQARISCSTGSERGTSSRGPCCGPGIVRSPKAEIGRVAPAASAANVIWWARSIYIPSRLVHMRSFLVASRISVLVHTEPGE